MVVHSKGLGEHPREIGYHTLPNDRAVGGATPGYTWVSATPGRTWGSATPGRTEQSTTIRLSTRH